MQLDQNAAELLAEQAGNDIRQSLNALQMWYNQIFLSNSIFIIMVSRNSSCKVCKYSDMKDGLSRIGKDKVLRQSPFDACLNILSGGFSNKETLEERYNAFFIDYSLTPLLVQQNYID
jgi:hypothetical protein